MYKRQAVFCAIAGGIGSRIIAAERRRSRSPLWKVSFCRNGRAFEGTGLLDSGNGLYDPYTGKPVCIIDPSEAGKLGLLDKNAPLRLIQMCIRDSILSYAAGRRRELLRFFPS